MRALIILVVSIAYISLCGASYSYPVPHSGISVFNLNKGTGHLEFNRERLVTSPHTTGHVYAETSKKEETSHHHTTTTIHQTPVVTKTETKPVNIPTVPVLVQHPTVKVDIPFYETTPNFVPEIAEYEKNMELLQTLCAQRDVITTQIEQFTEIQKPSTTVHVEQYEVMSTLLRQREFLNFQINNLVSLLGLETTYNTQFQVVETSQQILHPHLPAVPQNVEKKIVFFEPPSAIPAIYPPTPVKAQTFHLTSTESHKPVNYPNVLSALEAQRDMITAALSKLLKSQKQDKRNLVDFYTTRRDIITTQIAQIKELQKGHAQTTIVETTKPTVAHQTVEKNTHSTETISTSGLLPTVQEKYEETTAHHLAAIRAPETTKVEATTVVVETPSKHQTVATQEGDLLAVLTMIRDSLQSQIQLLVSNSKYQEQMGEDKESLLKTLKAECDIIDLQIAHAMGKFNIKLSTTTSKPTSTTTENEHIHIPHQELKISREYLPTY